MRRRWCLNCTAWGIAVACALALTATSVRADGDPASDALIAQNVFYPYSSPASPAAQDDLNARVAAAHRAGIDLKVAVIARAVDLGSITALYRQPQRYARFLDTEISFNRKIPLIVVMPDGFGVEGLSAALARRILSSPPPTGATGTELATATSVALSRALAESGRPRSDAGVRASRPDSGRIILLLALILAALLVAGTLIMLRVFFPPSRS